MIKLVNIVKEEIAETRKLLEAIELRQTPSIYYESLLFFFKQICDYASETLEYIPVHMGTPTRNKKRTTRILRRMIYLSSSAVRQINSYCGSFDYADRLIVPNASIQLLNKILREITNDRAFIVQGISEFNYMYNPIGQRLNELASTISDKIGKLDDSFAIISFPLARKDNLLANCNIFHELGHLIVDCEDLSNRFFAGLDKDKQDKITEIIERHIGDPRSAIHQYGFESIQQKSRITKTFKNWVHEVMADVIGLYLIGPAIMFSFLNIIEPMGAYQRDDDEHPCSVTRIKIMIGVLTRLRWSKIIRTECPDIWQRAKDIAKTEREKNTIFDAPDKCLPVVLDVIIGMIKKLCNKHAFKPNTFLSHKEDIYAILERAVPPVEMISVDTNNRRLSYFDAVSIINAGWFFYQKDFPSWENRFGKLAFIEKGELLNRLLTKAIDITFVKQAEKQ